MEPGKRCAAVQVFSVVYGLVSAPLLLYACFHLLPTWAASIAAPLCVIGSLWQAKLVSDSAEEVEDAQLDRDSMAAVVTVDKRLAKREAARATARPSAN